MRVPDAGSTGLFERIDEIEESIERREPSIQALLPEDGRFTRLRTEARALVGRHPDPAHRPPLFGVVAGVKDIFHVDGWPTRAGSRLPPELFHGDEADSVSRLKTAGALILGKTVTTEFAHFAPGPTRNPRNLEHTPGGSSSGSAAAVAAGYCDVALGTQTIGSIVRPASFCGVVGLKPSFDRVSARGVIPLAPSLDHVGCLAADVETAARVARVLYSTWSEVPSALPKPVLGIPEGPYLDRVPADTLEWFSGVCDLLGGAGYELRRVAVMPDFGDVSARHEAILAAEAARVHAVWFEEYPHLYGSKTADLIRRGRSVTSDELATASKARDAFRAHMQQVMVDNGIDAWISPSSLGPAPKGLESTGDPVMNLPWTHAGFPVVGMPAGNHPDGLPMGLQIAGRWQQDEVLLGYAAELEARLCRPASGELQGRL